MTGSIALLALHGRPPKYRLHKSTGQAYVEFHERPIYLGRAHSPESWEKYHRLINEWLASGRTGVPASVSGSVGGGAAAESLQIRELILRYWRYAKAYYRLPDGSPTSELNTQKQALRLLRRLYGRCAVSSFGPKKLKAVRQAMIEKGWSRPHLNKQVSRLKSLFRWAVENELAPVTVHQALLAVRGLRLGRCGGVPEPRRGLRL